MVLVAPDHVESATGNLLAKVTAAEQGAISGKYLFEAGDVVYSKIRPYLRKAILADFEGLSSADMYPLRPHGDVVPRFLLALLLGEHFSRFAEIVSVRSGFPKINREEFAEYVTSVPPFPEQQRIAEILDTIDEAIRKTEQIIAKLEQVNHGLLHVLLTRGIDGNGELRDPDRHPEQFKDSVLGRMPKEWEIGRLGDDADILHGYAFEGMFFTERPDGPVLLTPGNFHRNGGLYFTSANTKYFTGSVPPNYILSNGDLLTVMTDLSPKTLILARTVILGETFEVLHNQRIGKVVQRRPDEWLTKFLCLAMNAPRVRSQVIQEATGTTVRHTSPGRMLSSLLAKPRCKEQATIVRILDEHDRRQGAETRAAEKLRLLKQGLMEDLLTGRVRVTPLLGEKP